MAAKVPVKPKAKTAKTVKKTKTSSGLSKFTAAQYSAYLTASKAAIQKAQLAHSTEALRQRRVQAAFKVQAKLAAKRHQGIVAKQARNAVRASYQQSVTQKQSKHLRLQAASRLFKAQSVVTQKQFAYSGEAIHARTTNLQTLTSAQALSITTRKVNAARKAALSKNKPKKSGTAKARTSKSPYAAIGRQAGIQAAARVPASKTRKAARMLPVMTVNWITAGNDVGEENCVAVAIANHLLYHTGCRLPDEEVRKLVFSRLDIAVYNLRRRSWKAAALESYTPVLPERARPGMVIGFEVTVNGNPEPHCGVLMPGNEVVSWGEVVPLESDIEEAWELTWLASNR